MYVSFYLKMISFSNSLFYADADYSFVIVKFFDIQVVFTESIEPYKELRNRVFTDKLFERHFKIGFYNEEIKNAYEKLLENRCKLCEKQPPFRTFSMLSDHMRKIHERFFCDLCVKHLRVRIFYFVHDY